MLAPGLVPDIVVVRNIAPLNRGLLPTHPTAQGERLARVRNIAPLNRGLLPAQPKLSGLEGTQSAVSETSPR